MFQTPTISDFRRNLSAIVQKGHSEARSAAVKIMSDAAGRGVSQSTGVIWQTIGSYDPLHERVVAEAMRLIHDFSERGHFTPTELASSAREQLHPFASNLLGLVPAAGFPVEADRARKQYEQVFSQRLDSALRDIEIGFIGGRNMIKPTKDADRRAIVLQRFYDLRHTSDWVAIPSSLAAFPEDQKIETNICKQLSESGLINWKQPIGGALEGMGQITARGVDVIEGNAKSPIAITIDNRQDNRQFAVTGSTSVQIGDGNAQGFNLTADKMVAAVNQSAITESVPEKQKSFFKKIIENPVVTKILGHFIPAAWLS